MIFHGSNGSDVLNDLPPKHKITKNGRLRLIRCSHIKLCELLFVNAHTESLSRVEKTQNRLLGSPANQAAISVTCDDVIVGGALLIHCAFSSEKSEDSILILL